MSRIDELIGGSGSSRKTGSRIDELMGKTGASGTASRIEALTGRPAPAPKGDGLFTTAKGLGRMAVDVISRPNYAVAGAAEELFAPQGQGGLAAIKRAGSEILSGIGPIEGQKEGFTEVMEQAGVGELGKLSDVLGGLYSDTGEGLALQRGGALDFTARGAVGLIGDIGLDPTTYLTAGGSAARKFTTETGTKFLSKTGQATLREITEKLRPAMKLLDDAPDLVSRENASRQILKERNKLMDDAIKANPKLLDPTGIKFFGEEVVSSRALKGLSQGARDVVTSLPGGDWAARQAQSLGDQLQRPWNAFAKLHGLPQEATDAAKFIFRRNKNSATYHKAKLAEQWAGIDKDYEGLASAYGKGKDGRKALGKKFADWREQTGTPKVSEKELELFGRISKIYDDMEGILVREGVLTPEQAAKYAGKYLHHAYEDLDVLMEVAENAGRSTDKTLMTEGFQRERQFGSYAEAEEWSKALRAKGLEYRASGGKRGVYGELKPEYDAMKNLGDYIQQTTDGIWRKKTFEELRETFGVKLDDFYDPAKVYALDATRQVPKADRELIETYLSDSGKFGKGDWADATKGVEELLPKLSPDGQKELGRELTSLVRSESQLIRLEKAIGKDLMPDVKVRQVGDVDDYYKKWGIEETGLVKRKGKLWGDTEIHIPSKIAEQVEKADGDILKGLTKNEAWQKFLKGWDWYSNKFKMITYPGYPSGYTRDVYNNLMNGYLALGVGIFTKPLRAIRAMRGGADTLIESGGVKKAAPEWLEEAARLGVTDPTARQFMQATGEEGIERAGTIQKLRIKRGNISDNPTRLHLWFAAQDMGMTPEDAAALVKEFNYDYGELSRFDRDFVRRVIPFSVFPRKTIELYPKILVKTPGRVANLVKPFRGREDENNSMTTWEGEGFKVRLDRDGKNLTMLNGVDIPIRALDTLWRGDPRKTAEGLLGMVGPAIKIPYMAASGRDPFRGQEFGRQQYYGAGAMMSKAPKAIQLWAGFKEERDAAGRPKYTMRQDRVQMLAEFTLLSRVLSTSERAFREQVREPNMAARFLDFFTGLRAKTLNLDEEQAKQMERKAKIAEEEAVKQGEKREFRKIYTPKAR